MNVNFTRQFLFVVWLAFGQLIQFSANAQTVNTIAGGGSSTGVMATAYGISFPISVAFDAGGNYYVNSNGAGSVLKVSTSGIVTTVGGGNGTTPIVDGASATSGTFINLSGLVLDAAGNIYITELSSSRVRKISTLGIVTTIAGNGTQGFSGDGGAATAAELKFPLGLAIDGTGNIYIADLLNNRVRKVTPGGIITTVAGNGTAGFSGDGGAATSATLNQPIGVAVDASGNLYIADEQNSRIRKVTPGGIISTVAGNGTPGFSGDGGPATSAMIGSPSSVSVDPSGNLFITSNQDNRIRKVSSGGTITTLAGNGIAGFSGDGGAATSAQLNAPWSTALDAAGNVYVADESNFRIREINTSGTITTAAGNGSSVIGDNGPATSAVLYSPQAVFVDHPGNVYFPDKNRVMQVDPSGNLSTIAGNGIAATQGDGGLATRAEINNPFGVYKDATGNIYIGCAGDFTIRKVDPSGIISTFAGNGTQGYTGDGGAATSASIGHAQGITGDAAGNIYFTDFDHAVIRKVTQGGIISTFAGTGTAGYAGDGGAATSAQLGAPNSICIDATGNIYVGDDAVNSVRKITPGGIISTVAGGTASTGNTGDGGPATSALFGDIEGLTCDANGNLYIADGQQNRIRRVDAGTGIISAFAGNGTAGFAGDGGPALSAEFHGPWALSLDAQGNIYVGDATNQRVRKISVDYTLATTNTTVTQTISGILFADINDNVFHRLVTITPTAGGNALAGSVDFSLSFDPSVQLYNGHPYVTRHYDITPATNAATAQAMVKLYFLQSEFTAYNDYVTTNSLSLPFLPNSPTDLGAIANLSVLQFHGTGTAPANYSGGAELITPTVQYNATNSWWEISFPVNGFSGFYITSGTVPLPLNLLSFTGVQHEGDVTLKWSTANEVGTKTFFVERSKDAKAFASIGSVAAANTTGTNNYNYVDPSIPSGTWYYRLKMQDVDGKYTYSPVVSITAGVPAQGLVLYPNPVKDRLFVQVQATQPEKCVLRLMDMAGKVLQQQNVEISTGVNAFTFNTDGLARGTYLIICSGSKVQKSQFVKP